MKRFFYLVFAAFALMIPFRASAQFLVGNGGFGSMVSCYSALGTILGAGTCHVAPLWQEKWAASLTMNLNASGFVFDGPARINMGAFQLIFPDVASGGGSLAGPFVAGQSMWGSSPFGGQNFGTNFIYTGTSAAFVVGASGDASNNVSKMTLKNIALDLTGAGSSALGIDTYGLGFFDFDKIIIGCGPGAGNSQIGLRMNINALTDGEGGVMSNSDVASCNISVQLNSTSYKTFQEVNVQGATGSTIGFDLESAAAIRIFGGGTNANSTTAYQFGGTSNVNQVISGCESGTNAATFGASANKNTVICTNVGNMHAATDSGTNNQVWQPGGIWQSVQPAIASGFGSSPSVVGPNGPGSFTINVGTGGSATNGSITLPKSATGWNCTCEDITTFSTTVFRCRQTAAGSSTSVNIGNFTSAGAAGAWVASDIVNVSCAAR